MTHMLNEDRVKQMTRMAIYHRREGKALRLADNYREKDYCAMRRFLTWLLGTVLFLLLLFLAGAFILIRYGTEVTTKMAAAGGFAVLILYICLMFLLLHSTTRSAKRRYRTSRQKLDLYDREERKLTALYQEEEKDGSQEGMEKT